MSTKDVFLSYGREPEVTQFVVQLKCDLESHGIGVWLDIDDIPAGSDWHGAIGKGLHRCRALIAVITEKYISSRFCSSELYTADGDRKLIFPVIYEEVDFRASDTGMGVKYVISGINWTMFRPRIDDYVTSLCKLVEGLRDKGVGPLAQDSSYLHDQLLRMHNSPPHTSLSGMSVSSFHQASLSLSSKSGVCPVASFGLPPPSSPPPGYSDIFPTTSEGIADGSIVMKDVTSKKHSVPSKAESQSALGDPCIVAPPRLPASRSNAFDSAKVMLSCNEGGDDTVPLDEKSAGGGANGGTTTDGANIGDITLIDGLASIKISNGDGRLNNNDLIPTAGTISNPTIDNDVKNSAIGAERTDIKSTTADSGKSTVAITTTLCPPFSVGHVYDDNVTTPLTGTSTLQQPSLAFTSDVGLLDNSIKSPPHISCAHLTDSNGKESLDDGVTKGPSDAGSPDPSLLAISNTRSSDTFNTSMLDTADTRPSDAPSATPPDAFNKSTPDTPRRSPLHIPVAIAAAVGSHASHLGIISKPIKRIGKIKRHLKTKLHNRWHSKEQRESALPDGEEVEGDEEEVIEDGHVEEQATSSVGTLNEASSPLRDRMTSEPREGDVDIASSPTSSGNLAHSLPQMHLKGLRLKLANKLLKGALLPPAPQDPTNQR